MYLEKRQGVYYFRQRIPTSFITLLRQNDIRVSLKTKSLKIAKLRANLLSLRLNNLFLKRQILDLTTIRDVINAYIKEAIEEYSDLSDLRHDAIAFTTEDGIRYGGHTVEAIAKELAILRQLSNSDDKILLAQKAQAILPRTNIPIDFFNDLDDRYKAIFNHELIKGECQILIHDELTPSRTEEEDTTFEAINNIPISSKLIKKLQKNYGLDGAKELLIAYTQQEEEPQHLLSECIENFVENESLARGWKIKTKLSILAKLNLVVRVLGDKDIKNYTRKDFEAYRTVLLKLPTNINKNPNYKNKSIDDLISLNVKTLNKRTVNEYITSLYALLNWVILQGYITNNLAKSLKIKIAKKARDDKYPFNSEEIKNIYKAISVYKEKKPHFYFVPLIGFYNGFRVNEICQLHIEDIRQEKGIWCFDINENINSKGELVKSVKNLPTKRVVPMNPELIKLGFIDYYHKIVSLKNTRVFPLLNYSRDGYGKVVSDFFTRSKHLFITHQEKKSFHSTRHNFIQQLRNSKIDDHRRRALTGRGDDDIDFDYGESESFSLQDLLKAIKKVKYPEIL